MTNWLRRHVQLIAWIAAVATMAVYVHISVGQAESDSYARCTDRRANVNRTNAFYAAMAELEASNRFIDQPLRQQRVALYRGMVLAAPDCGTKP